MIHFRFKTAMLAGAVFSAAVLSGCVERKITIVSDPPGALAYVNDVEMGRTPITFQFRWYGDYDIRLRLNSKEMGSTDDPPVYYFLHTHQKASAPPDQWLGIDLIAELTPYHFKDEKVWVFTVPQVAQPSDEQLLADAKVLRAQLRSPMRLGPQPTTPATPVSTVPATQSASEPVSPGVHPTTNP